MNDLIAAPVTVTSIITASSTLFIAVTGLIAALTIFVPLLRKVSQTAVAVDEVHLMVNQQRTDMQRYQVALVGVLKAHGIDVPVDQSLPVDD